MTSPLTSPFVQESASTTTNWRRVFNRANTSHRTKVQADKKTLYVCGTAFERNRFVTRSDIPLFKKPLEQRLTLAIYQDLDHSYIRLHKPGQVEDMVYGKYALNKGLVKLSSNVQIVAYALPAWLRRTVGVVIVGLCWLISSITTLLPRKARLNDEVRLYRQVGQDYREHPNVTFEIDETEYHRIAQNIQQLLKNPESTNPPLRFQALGNNCSGFPRDAFCMTDFPGGYTDYFEEEAIRTRGFGFVGSVLDVYGFWKALIRLFKTFASLMGILRHRKYLPTVTMKDVKKEIPFANSAVDHARHSLTNSKVQNQPTHEWLDALSKYFCAGHRFGYCEHLQRAGHYYRALSVLTNILDELEDKIAHKAYAVHATPESRYRDKSELLFCQAIANKITFKATSE